MDIGENSENFPPRPPAEWLAASKAAAVNHQPAAANCWVSGAAAASRKPLGELSENEALTRRVMGQPKTFGPSQSQKLGFTIYQDPVASSSPSSPQLPSQENHHLHNDVSFMSAVSSPEEIDDKENEATSIIGRSSDLQPQQRQQILPPVHYQKEICKYIKERQSRHLPRWNYMSRQPDITHGMRSILVDWLVEVGVEYKLQAETIYLAVNYVDRFLSHMSVERKKLQLVGTACMFIASKYEEIYPPDVGEFAYITDDTYTKKQILRMEQLVLKVLNFDLALPSQFLFVTMLSEAAGSDHKVACLAQYLSELTLLEADKFLQYSYSHLAAASVALARHTLGLTAWPQSVRDLSDLNVEEFQECLLHLHASYTNAPDVAHQAIREKYKHPKYCAVAEIPPVPIC